MRQFEDGGEGDDPWDVEAGKVKKKTTTKTKKNKTNRFSPQASRKHTAQSAP